MQQLEGFYHSKFRPTFRNLYERARENVGNMEMARELWRARDRDLQERRDQEPVHQVQPDHGAGVWTPGPMIAEADVQERARQLEARIKVLQQDDRSARDPVIDSPLILTRIKLILARFDF